MHASAGRERRPARCGQPALIEQTPWLRKSHRRRVGEAARSRCRTPLCINFRRCKTRCAIAPARRTYVMSNLVHNEQVRLAATFWNNLSIAALLSVFLVPAFYTRHTALQQALSIGVGLAAAIALRMLSHWWLTRLRE